MKKIETDIFDSFIEKLTIDWNEELREKYMAEYNEMKSAGESIKNILSEALQDDSIKESIEKEIRKRIG